MSSRSRARRGKAEEFKLSQGDLIMLYRATILPKLKRAGALSRGEYKAEQAALMASMQALESRAKSSFGGKRIGGGAISGTRILPLCYVPAYNHRGTLKMPKMYNTSAGHGRALARAMQASGAQLNTAKNGAPTGSGGNPYGRVKGALIMLFGRKHCGIIGWITHPLKANGRPDYTRSLQMRKVGARKARSTRRRSGASAIRAGGLSAGERAAVGLGKRCVSGTKSKGGDRPGESVRMEE